MEYNLVDWLLTGGSSKSSKELSDVRGEDKGDEDIDSLKNKLI
jgi:hypothetical protein